MTKEELEHKISILLSCKNCPENKGGYICEKEYEVKCLSQKTQYIKELQDEIAELEEENELVKSLLYCTKGTCDNCGFVKCENFQRQRKNESCVLYISYKDRLNNLAHETDVLIERYNNSEKKLTKAKDIIKKFLLRENDCHNKTESKYELLCQAEQFLKEV